ncbi:sensor histidine kinase [Tessaracoccus sp. ZS01]|uniref:sensor histidine kinase n=1 Tax=Tessaracoccus sp. ZS01 TaxID=1906324 RepID=UPI00096F602E|nr:sensor histidine kinase [Tessaracoccus sp. ZS01]OMG58617.1 hypothetical protein BJN44_00515 [Tessaracoccus sp. ZS01]
MVDAIRAFFGMDEDYVRPSPTRPAFGDIAVASLLCIISMATVMVYSEIDDIKDHVDVWPSLGAIALAGVLLAYRRVFPITVMLLLTGVHFIVVGSLWPVVSSTPSMQIVYFLGIYTALAYAKRRDTLALAAGAVVLAMTVWLIVDDSYNRSISPAEFHPTAWYYAATLLINAAYFGGAMWLGRNAWRQARDAHDLDESKALVTQQAHQLADQAVLAERLRIARDLHDSVAHHISLIGIQTAAARRAMDAKPELAAEALVEVEEMSRSAVSELRTLLGSLRDVSPTAGAGSSLEALEALCEEASGEGLDVSYELVGDPARAAELTTTQSGALLRIAQEALTNVRRHSTADHARVVVRLGDTTEVEITDDGMPVHCTAGSGLGHVGMRERIAALGGTIDIGPRATRGYRVHAVLPRRV